VPDCSGGAGPLQNHTESPLVFKLDEDLSEGIPLDKGSSMYEVIVTRAQHYLSDLQANIRSDNTSTVVYDAGPEGRVCCDTQSLICRCPWD
jgi:hypothetical protein